MELFALPKAKEKVFVARRFVLILGSIKPALVDDNTDFVQCFTCNTLLYGKLLSFNKSTREIATSDELVQAMQGRSSGLVTACHPDS